jgi:uncharacterized protein involved in response to NO
MAAIPRLKLYAGPALLSYGFRPFFFLGSIWAGIEVLAWMPMFYGELSLATAFSPRDWHVHELLFGFVPAIVACFLLTAIPNWTGRLPLQGLPLAGLVLVWLAGRYAVAVSAGIGLARHDRCGLRFRGPHGGRRGPDIEGAGSHGREPQPAAGAARRARQAAR